MIEIQRGAAPMTIEALGFVVVALLDIIIVLGKSAPAETEAHIRVRREQLAKPQLAVKINRGHGQAERGVGVQQRRVVVVIVRVERLGALAGQGIVIAELKKVAWVRVKP